MSYYVYYSLEVKKDKTKLGRAATEKHEEAINKSTFAEYGHYDYGMFEDRIANWNEDKTMLKYSKKHPTLVFFLEAVAQERDVYWGTYYKNGKKQYSKGKVTYDRFDEKKLT